MKHKKITREEAKRDREKERGGREYLNRLHYFK